MFMFIMSRNRSSPSLLHESTPGNHVSSPPKSLTTPQTLSGSALMSMSTAAFPMAAACQTGSGSAQGERSERVLGGDEQSAAGRRQGDEPRGQCVELRGETLLARRRIEGDERAVAIEIPYQSGGDNGRARPSLAPPLLAQLVAAGGEGDEAVGARHEHSRALYGCRAEGAVVAGLGLRDRPADAAEVGAVEEVGDALLAAGENAVGADERRADGAEVDVA